MEKKNKNKSINNAIYIISAFMLVTVIALAMVTSMLPAKKTDPKKVTGTKEYYTAEENTDTSDTEKYGDMTKAQKNTDKTSDTGDTAKSTDKTDSSVTTVPKNPSQSVSVPIEFYLPVTGHLSKDYSMDMPVFSLTMNDYRAHSGIDIQADNGVAVSAIADGEVTNRYTDPFMGVCVEVTHSGGMVSRYMNLGTDYPAETEVGCPVYGGQVIGCVGESAAVEAADSSHLHLEVLLDGKHTDPLDYISYEAIEDGYSE